jgi:hypothetical protein
VTRSGLFRFPAGKLFTGALLAALFGGCLQDKVAGGSSEVDNPVLMAFIDSAGAPITATGTISIYRADQNPALDPYPLLSRQIEHASSIKLSAGDFAQGLNTDSTYSYNVLLINNDGSSGALLLNLSYQPATGRYVLDSAVVVRVNVPVVRLVRYVAYLDEAGDTGLVRVFIPGTPFQSVVVDSAFIIDGVPEGTHPLRALFDDGSERPIKPGNGNNGHHQIDRGGPPKGYPPGNPPVENFRVHAGSDVSLPASPNGATTYSLSGSVQGFNANDPRLGIKWSQILPGPQGAKAEIDDKRRLNTRVTFPRPGAYQFILTAGAGNQKIEDTVLIGIQAPLENAVFIEPTAGDTVPVGRPFDVFWEGRKTEKLLLEVSRDGGTTWQTLAADIPSYPGPNKKPWTPPVEQVSANCLLRLRDSTNTNIAVSGKFVLADRPIPFIQGTGQFYGYPNEMEKIDGPGG